MEEEIKIDDAWHMLMHYPNVSLAIIRKNYIRLFWKSEEKSWFFTARNRRPLRKLQS